MKSKLHIKYINHKHRDDIDKVDEKVDEKDISSILIN